MHDKVWPAEAENARSSRCVREAALPPRPARLMVMRGPVRNSV